MKEKLDLSVIILTGNEQIHIERCLDKICDIAQQVFVIDCYSNDSTVRIANEYPEVSVLYNNWVNYATQFNWALDNAPIKTKWVLRLDADEYLEDSTIERLRRDLDSLPDNVTAVSLRLQHIVLGKFLKGGTGKKYLTRLFRYGKARSEVRNMDEHLELLDGVNVTWEEALVDDNLNDLTWWTTKHNGYATREAIDLLNMEYEFTLKATVGSITGQAKRIRSQKSRYAKLPLFFRPFAYFIYRYIFKGGFLEGKEGFIWCFLQGWWYRTLVDAKIYEIKKICKCDKEQIRIYLNQKYNASL